MSRSDARALGTPGNATSRSLHQVDRLLLVGRRFSSYAKVFGLRRAASLTSRDFWPRSEALTSVVSPRLRHPITLRTGTADVRTFIHVVVEEGYAQPDWRRPATIVDAGAHIGIAAAWFATRFPDARVIALEPEPSNFELLEANMASYPNVVCVRAGLWSATSEMPLVDPGDSTWGYRLDAASPGSASSNAVRVPTVSVADIIERFDLESVDLLKVDIEGSEAEVFDNSSGWIDKVDAIAIELHDRFNPGSSRAFFRATEGFVDEGLRGETTFVRRAHDGSSS